MMTTCGLASGIMTELPKREIEMKNIHLLLSMSFFENTLLYSFRRSGHDFPVDLRAGRIRRSTLGRDPLHVESHSCRDNSIE